MKMKGLLLVSVVVVLLTVTLTILVGERKLKAMRCKLDDGEDVSIAMNATTSPNAMKLDQPLQVGTAALYCKIATRASCPHASLPYVTPLPKNRGMIIEPKIIEHTLHSKLIICFLGTYELADIVCDLYVRQVEADFGHGAVGGKVHRGILKRYLAMQPSIKKIVKARPNDTQIEVVGHSLGGALAILCVADLVTDPTLAAHQANVTGVALAPPKVGDASFAATMAKASPSLTCVVNTADAIPTMPIGLFGYKWSHVGRVLCFRRDEGSWMRNHNSSSYAEHLQHLQSLQPPTPLESLAQVDAPPRHDGHVANGALVYL